MEALALSPNFFKRKNQPSSSMNILPIGWQFYSKPTTLEPPGTVFRIDKEKKKYIVDYLKVKPQKGEEAFGRVQTSMQAKTSIVASFLGLTNLSISSHAEKDEQMIFEMGNIVKEVLTDAKIDPILKSFLEKLDYRVDNKYYIIREATTTDGIDFQLNKDQVINLGGEASLNQAISVKGEIFSSKKEENYILQKKFEKPMRVMFFPEEIKPVSAGLGGIEPELGLVPVKGVLEWDRS
jgi:hypothetical protein